MYYFIVNPHSRSGRGIEVWNMVEAELKKTPIDYKAYFTNGIYHAFQIASQLTLENDRCTLVVLGGDGTLNEVLSGISDYSKVTIGYISAGSSNDLARGLGLEKDPLKALSHILNPKHYLYMDVGRIRYKNKARNFGVSAGIGFDAAVCHSALKSRIKDMLNRFHLGKLTYICIALRHLMAGKRSDCTLILDGVKQIQCRQTLFISVMNQRYEGGGFMFCPKASYRDGYLDVCAATNLPVWKCLFILPFALAGRHTRFKGISTYRAKKVTVLSDTQLPVHADGESCGSQNEINVSLEPRQARFINTKPF